MALTLLEANKIDDGNVKRQAIIQMFAETSDILRVLPIEDIQGDSYTYTLESELPGVGFRGINEAFSESTGVLNPQVEVLRICGGDLDVDLQLIRTRGIQVRDTHEAMKVKALSLTITDKLINGDSSVEPREFDGLRKRIGGSQLIASQINGVADGPLSLFQLDTAIDAVDGPTHLLMSKSMRNLINASARAGIGGVVEWDLDEFGTRTAFYNTYPILIVDTNATDQKIIDFDEAGSAGGNDHTSIYVVSFGEDKVKGIQNGSIDVRDLGEIDAKPVMRTRVDWSFGFVVAHGRAVSRVWGITKATPVA